MRLIVVRHGETEENRVGIIQGHLHGVLSKLGKEQAERLAGRLREEKIDLIISSDLARALDTAKIVAKHHDCELVLDERLRERFLGRFQGRTKESIGIPKNRLIADYINGEDAEAEDLFFARAGALVESVKARSEENILLVGHNGICKAVIGNLLGVRDLKEIVGLKNTSVSEYVFDGGKWVVVKFNCVRHLG